MENIVITTYRGLSLVSGRITIRQLFAFIRGDVYRDRIRRLREAMEEGDTAKADRMKKQLPYHTITATYIKERLAYSLDTYQDIITLDCDDMPAEKLPEFRLLVNECPDTLGDFVSPRMHGLKNLRLPHRQRSGSFARRTECAGNCRLPHSGTLPPPHVRLGKQQIREAAQHQSGYKRKRSGTGILRVA